MITVVTEVCHIPDGMIVRNVSGSKAYTVQRDLKIYADAPENRKEIRCETGTLFLTADNSINCVSGCKKVAVDFQNPEDAISFLETLVCDD